MKKETIHYVITGGTIDSYYDGSKDTAVPREHSIIPRYIKSLHLPFDVKFSEVCMKDSRELTDEDRKKVLETIEASPHKYFLITHGTYTMPDTARVIEANLSSKDKTIIFTGSMIPLEGFAPSDAGFNIGFAVAQFGIVDPGIHVAMNGKVFDPQEIMKSLSEGAFISIFRGKSG